MCVCVCVCVYVRACVHAHVYNDLLLTRGARPKATCTWFLEIALVHVSVCVCVCVSAPVAINNQWHDMV